MLFVHLTQTTLPLETTFKVLRYIWTSAGYQEAPIKVSADLHIGSFYIFGRLLENLKGRKDAEDLLITEPSMFSL